MILGVTRHGTGGYAPLMTDAKRLMPVTVPATVRVPKVCVYLHGQAAGRTTANQAARAVVYDSTGRLVATSDEVVIARDQPEGWVDFRFPPLAPLEPIANLVATPVTTGGTLAATTVARYAVASRDARGLSLPSNVAQVTTSASGTGRVDLTWAPNPAAVGQAVFYGGGAGTTWNSVLELGPGVGSTSHLDELAWFTGVVGQSVGLVAQAPPTRPIADSREGVELTADTYWVGVHVGVGDVIGAPGAVAGASAGARTHSPYNDVVLVEPSLVSYWRFEEAANVSTAKDSKGSNDGTYSPLRTVTAGAVGGNTRSIVPDGDDTVSVPDAPNLRFTTAFTFDAWVYVSDYVGEQTILSKNGNLDYSYRVRGGSGLQQVSIRNGGAGNEVYSNTPLPLNQWNHCLAAWDGTTVRYYLNGVPDGSPALAAPTQTSTAPLYIGSTFGSANFLRGRLDEVAVYNTALSATHAAARWEAGRIGSDLYADGPRPLLPSAFGVAATELMVYMPTFSPWSTPAEDDLYLARLPRHEAREAFAGSPAPGSLRLVECGWHGTNTRPERGAVAVADRAGPLAGMVGERVRVACGTAAVYALVVGDAEIAEDISLSREAFVEIGGLWEDSLDVVVEVME